MKMQKHYSLAHTDKVIRLIRKLLKGRKEKGEIIISSWANGREQGYKLEFEPKFTNGHNWLMNPCLGIAQGRAGDSITVVPGHRKDFDGMHNHPSTEVWKKVQSFDSDFHAAAFCVDYLLS